MFFSGRIAEDKSVGGSKPAEFSENPGIRKFRADKINMTVFGSQINGQSGFMFAASRNGYILFG